MLDTQGAGTCWTPKTGEGGLRRATLEKPPGFWDTQDVTFHRFSQAGRPRSGGGRQDSHSKPPLGHPQGTLPSVGHPSPSPRGLSVFKSARREPRNLLADTEHRLDGLFAKRVDCPIHLHRKPMAHSIHRRRCLGNWRRPVESSPQGGDGACRHRWAGMAPHNVRCRAPESRPKSGPPAPHHCASKHPCTGGRARQP